MSEEDKASPSPHRDGGSSWRRMPSFSISSSEDREDSRKRRSRLSNTNSEDDKERALTMDPITEAFSPSVEKEVLENMIKTTKRADNKAITLVLNNATNKSFNKKMIGEGKWNRDTADKMRDKYYMPPSLKGTKLHMGGLQF